MPAEVETMFSDRTPWHGKGIVVDKAQSATEALVLAGLDWDVELKPLTYAVVSDDGVSSEEVPDRVAVIRNSDHSYYGTVSKKYSPLQNREAFALADDIVGAPGGPHYRTAGALYSGRQVFMTLQFPENVRIADQADVEMHMVLATSHDGSMALTVMNTPIVVVCKNTLNLALNNAKAKWSVRHDGTAGNRIEEARSALGIHFDYRKEFEAQMNRFADVEFTKAAFEALVKDVFPSKATAGGGFSAEQYALIGVLDASPNIHESIRWTPWGAVNAVREWDDWGRVARGADDEARSDSRLDAVLWGRNVKRSNDVYRYLLDKVPALSAS